MEYPDLARGRRLAAQTGGIFVGLRKLSRWSWPAIRRPQMSDAMKSTRPAHLSTSPKENLPSRNGRDVGGVDEVGFDGYGSWVKVGNPQCHCACRPRLCHRPARPIGSPQHERARLENGWTSPVCALTAQQAARHRDAQQHASEIAIVASKPFTTQSTFMTSPVPARRFFLKTSTDKQKLARPHSRRSLHSPSVYTFEPAILHHLLLLEPALEENSFRLHEPFGRDLLHFQHAIQRPERTQETPHHRSDLRGRWNHRARSPETIQWSPDGSKVSSFVQRDDAGEHGELWYVDADRREESAGQRSKARGPCSRRQQDQGRAREGTR